MVVNLWLSRWCGVAVLVWWIVVEICMLLGFGGAGGGEAWRDLPPLLLAVLFTFLALFTCFSLLFPGCSDYFLPPSLS